MPPVEALGLAGQALRCTQACGDSAGLQRRQHGAADRGDVDDRRASRAQSHPRLQRAWDASATARDLPRHGRWARAAGIARVDGSRPAGGVLWLAGLGAAAGEASGSAADRVGYPARRLERHEAARAGDLLELGAWDAGGDAARRHSGRPVADAPDTRLRTRADRRAAGSRTRRGGRSRHARRRRPRPPRAPGQALRSSPMGRAHPPAGASPTIVTAESSLPRLDATEEAPCVTGRIGPQHGWHLCADVETPRRQAASSSRVPSCPRRDPAWARAAGSRRARTRLATVVTVRITVMTSREVLVAMSGIASSCLCR